MVNKYLTYHDPVKLTYRINYHTIPKSSNPFVWVRNPSFNYPLHPENTTIIMSKTSKFWLNYPKFPKALLPVSLLQKSLMLPFLTLVLFLQNQCIPGLSQPYKVQGLPCVMVSAILFLLCFWENGSEELWAPDA